jgi:hypothetical protein
MDFKMNGKANQVWDGDSLKRTLVRDYPGASNVQEALAQARAKQDPNEHIPFPCETKTKTPVTDVPVPATDYEIMRDCIKAIEAVFDPVAKYDPEIVSQLAKGTLETAEDAIKWRDGWLDLIKEHNASLSRF